jgi:hypothetical protein
VRPWRWSRICPGHHSRLRRTLPSSLATRRGHAFRGRQEGIRSPVSPCRPHGGRRVLRRRGHDRRSARTMLHTELGPWSRRGWIFPGHCSAVWPVRHPQTGNRTPDVPDHRVSSFPAWPAASHPPPRVERHR